MRGSRYVVKRGKTPVVSSEEAHKLLDADFTPMLSPKLAASIGGVQEPADLLRLPILDPGDIWWAQWFAAAPYATRNFPFRRNAGS